MSHVQKQTIVLKPRFIIYLFIYLFIIPQNNKNRKCLKQTSGITAKARQISAIYTRPKRIKKVHKNKSFVYTGVRTERQLLSFTR